MVDTFQHRRGGKQKGWTPATKAGFRDFLYSVMLDKVDFDNLIAFTLTSRECEPTAAKQQVRLKRLIERFRYAGATKWLYVVEFNRQRVPHYHGIIEGVNQADVFRAWRGVMGDLGVELAAQDIRYVQDQMAWFGYLASHLGKGGTDYGDGQRSSERAPEGWIADGSFGRVWRKSKGWDLMEGAKLDVHPAQRFVLRRRIRAFRVAEARALVNKAGSDFHHRNARRSLAKCRRMLKCNDRKRSEVRGAVALGVGEWIWRGLLVYSGGGNVPLG